MIVFYDHKLLMLQMSHFTTFKSSCILRVAQKWVWLLSPIVDDVCMCV